MFHKNSMKQQHPTDVTPKVDQPEQGGQMGTSPMLAGETNSVISQNVRELKNRGVNEREAHRLALSHATAGKKHPHRHKNLGKFLHARKDGKAHGSDSGNPSEIG